MTQYKNSQLTEVVWGNEPELCLWCLGELDRHLPHQINHCVKMVKRKLLKPRVDTNCRRCGHSQKEHNAKIYHNIIKEIPEWIEHHACGHSKRVNSDYEGDDVRCLCDRFW